MINQVLTVAFIDLLVLVPFFRYKQDPVLLFIKLPGDPAAVKIAFNSAVYFGVIFKIRQIRPMIFYIKICLKIRKRISVIMTNPAESNITSSRILLLCML